MKSMKRLDKEINNLPTQPAEHVHWLNAPQRRVIGRRKDGASWQEIADGFGVTRDRVLGLAEGALLILSRLSEGGRRPTTPDTPEHFYFREAR